MKNVRALTVSLTRIFLYRFTSRPKFSFSSLPPVPTGQNATTVACSKTTGNHQVKTATAHTFRIGTKCLTPFTGSFSHQLLRSLGVDDFPSDDRVMDIKAFIEDDNVGVHSNLQIPLSISYPQ